MILGQLELTVNKDHIFRHWKARKRAWGTLETRKQISFILIFINWKKTKNKKKQCANDTSGTQKKCCLGWFSGSDRPFVARNKTLSSDLKRKDWTTFGKSRCRCGACSQASHGGRETWQGCARSYSHDSLCRVVFEYTDFMQKRPWGKLHASLRGIYDYWGPPRHIQCYEFLFFMHKWRLEIHLLCGITAAIKTK